jgi:predicted metalloprotease with PDZ domain
VRIPGLVNWGTPAFSAGLEEGDVITAADGRAIASPDDWRAAIRARKPGDRLNVDITRHRIPMKKTITLAEDPTMDIVALESTGTALSADQKSMRDAWLASKVKRRGVAD